MITALVTTDISNILVVIVLTMYNVTMAEYFHGNVRHLCVLMVNQLAV